MATLTISTSGIARGRDCHEVEGISHTRVFSPDVNEAAVQLTAGQAYALAADLLNQCVQAGLIENWGVSFAPDPVSVIRP